MVADCKYYEGRKIMNAVGIDVSRGKSMVAIRNPFGKILYQPFEISHSTADLYGLAKLIMSLDGESKVVLENTGVYSDSVAEVLSGYGIFVSVVNAKLVHDYGGNTIRRTKTDRADALKIASFCLDKWTELKPYHAEDPIRKELRVFNRQLNQYNGIKVMMKNNLIALLEQVFPGINNIFSNNIKPDGHEKWIDFISEFWHVETISTMSSENFKASYKKWCSDKHYHFSQAKADKIYELAKKCYPTMLADEMMQTLIGTAVSELNHLCENISVIKNKMGELASKLPEYQTVLDMHGVGKVLAPQLIAEIGDIRNFPKRTSLASFAGIEPPENQSGSYEQRSRRISKQGSPHLRKALFQVMCCVIKLKRTDESVYQFLDKKRSEGKPYKVYMIAAANKFLRIYYAKVNACMGNLQRS
jgi:transposase